MPHPLPEPLPPGTVLLHIGPHKTGTTALQGSFHSNRKALAQHGVHYVGRTRQPMLAVLSLTGRQGFRGGPQATRRHWRDLVDEVRVASGEASRVVVSSEYFADAAPETIRAIVDDLGPRVHVVVTLRPLAQILPSQWQQYVQNMLRMRYDDWLDHMLRKPPYRKPTPSFWNRHDHAGLVARWAEVVAPADVTVIVLDDDDRTLLLRAFAAMLDLPAGVLVPEHGVQNRSLTLGEVELIRRLNAEFRRRGWSHETYARIVRTGVGRRMLLQRRPAPDEAAITTPQWALDRAAELGSEAAQAIAGMGVRVVGDVRTLGLRRHTLRTDDPPRDPSLPASAAALAVAGAVSGAISTPQAIDRGLDDQPVGSLGSRTLARVLVTRLRRRARIRVRARLPRRN